jgi:CDP-2,3-bis-(O-geranylgeranyl)-sn-glycerol synthase
MASFGAIFGDIFFSFLKRRLNIPRGAPWPFFDQWDFLIFGTLFSFPIWHPPLEVIVISFILTYFLHRIVNVLGYFLGLKNTPW